MYNLVYTRVTPINFNNSYNYNYIKTYLFFYITPRVIRTDCVKYQVSCGAHNIPIIYY